VIWLYAICERAPVTPLHGIGLAGAPLERVGEGQLQAVISRHAELPDVDGLDALWAHEEVVERLMAEGSVLPIRFGSRLPTAAALPVALATHRGELLSALDAVRGRVELAVRALRPAGGDGGDARSAEEVAAEARAADHDAGRAYLRRRLELRDRMDAAAAALHAPLAAAAVAGCRRPGRTPDEVLRASYLVERPAMAEFSSRAQRLQREHPELAVVCTGPWPPWSFVDVPVLSTVAGGEGARA
jgi:hypothetical protein